MSLELVVAMLIENLIPLTQIAPQLSPSSAAGVKTSVWTCHRHIMQFAAHLYGAHANPAELLTAKGHQIRPKQ